MAIAVAEGKGVWTAGDVTLLLIDYSRLLPRQGLETTCVEEVRTYDVSEYWKKLV
jgi:hypothetical protein